MAGTAQTGITGTVQKRVTSAIQVDEVITYCPGCKAFQTLWVDNNKLVLTRKYYQAHGRIYHDCGTDKPCRLYRTVSTDT